LFTKKADEVVRVLDFEAKMKGITTEVNLESCNYSKRVGRQMEPKQDWQVYQLIVFTLLQSAMKQTSDSKITLTIAYKKDPTGKQVIETSIEGMCKNVDLWKIQQALLGNYKEGMMVGSSDVSLNCELYTSHLLASAIGGRVWAEMGS
jgi:hypothetical protein